MEKINSPLVHISTQNSSYDLPNIRSVLAADNGEALNQTSALNSDAKSSSDLMTIDQFNKIFLQIEHNSLEYHRSKLQLPVTLRDIPTAHLLVLIPGFYQSVANDLIRAYSNFIRCRYLEEETAIERFLDNLDRDYPLETQGFMSIFSKEPHSPADTPNKTNGLFGVDVNIPPEIREAASNFNTGVKTATAGIDKISDLIHKLLPSSKEGTIFGTIADKIIYFIVSILNIARAQKTTDKLSILLQTLLGAGISITDRVMRYAKIIVEAFGTVLKLPSLNPLDLKDQDLKEMFTHGMSEDIFDIANYPELDALEDAIFGIATDLMTQGVSTTSFSRPTYLTISQHLVGVRNFIQLFEILVSYGKKIFFYLHMKILGRPFVVDEVKVLVDAATSWLDIANELLTTCKPGTLTSDIMFCRKVLDHHENAQLISKELILVGYNQHNFTPFFRAISLFNNLVDQAKVVMQTAQPRVEPMLIEFTGMPGTGKSTLLPIVVKSLLAFYNKKLDVKNPLTNIQSNIYERKPENVYWDGYLNQFCTTADDCFSFDDKDKQTEIANELISMCNTAPYPLHVAELANKANTFFDSKVVIITNNSMKNGYYCQPELKLSEPLAFARRKHFLVEVKANPAYATFRKDPSGNTCAKVNAMDFTNDLWVFRIIDPVSLQYLTEDIGYDLLLKHFVKTFNKILNKTNVWTTHLNKPVDAPELDDTLTYKSGLGSVRPVSVDGTGPKVERRKTKWHPLANLNKEELVIQGFHSNIIKVIEDVEEGVDTFTVIGMASRTEPIKVKYNDEIIRVYPHMIQINDRMWYCKYQPELKPDDRDYYLAYECTNIYAQPTVPERIKTQFNEIITETKTLITEHPWATTIFTTVSLLVTVSGLLAAAWFLFSPDGEPLINADGVTGVSSTPKTDTPTKTWRAKNLASKPFSGLKTQMDISSQEIASSCMRNYCDIFFSTDISVKGRSCTAVFLKGNLAITAKHMLTGLRVSEKEQLEGYITLEATHPDIVFNARYLAKDCEFWMDEDYDLVVIKFPKSCRRFQDITQHFVEDNQINGNISHTFLQVCKKANPPRPSIYATVSNHTKTADKVTYKNTFTGERETLARAIHYLAPHYPGECGSLLFAVNPSFTRGKILGMHVAGNASQGVATILTKRIVKEILDCAGMAEVLSDPSELVQQGTEDEEEKINLEHARSKLDPIKSHLATPKLDYGPNKFLGIVQEKYFHRLNSKDEYKPSKISGRITAPTTANSKLKPFWHNDVKISPMQNALNYFSKTKPDGKGKSIYCDALIREIVESVLRSIQFNSTMRKVSIQEAIDGLPETEYFGALHMKTAPGFGCKGMKWTKQQLEKDSSLSNKGKRFCFYEEHIVFFDGTSVLHQVPKLDLIKEITRMEEAYLQGKRYQNIAEMNPKAERLSFAKVEAGKTRAFYISQLAHTILGRMYFGTFIDNVMASMKSTGVTLGINPNSLDWDWVIHGPNYPDVKYVDGDFEKADFRRDPEIESILHDSIIKLTTEQFRIYDPSYTREQECQDWLVMEGLLSDISFTVVLLIMDELVKLEGNYFLSGAFCTAVLNSLYYKVALLYSYQLHLNSVKELITLIALENYGTLNNLYNVNLGNPATDPLQQKVHLTPREFTFAKLMQDKGFFEEFKSDSHIKNFKISFNAYARQFFSNYKRLPDPKQIQTRTNGDDFILILNSYDQYHLWFDFFDLQVVAKESGHVITPSEKTSAGTRYTKEKELTYLKRNFRKVPDLTFTLAPLKKEVLLEVLNWVKINSDSDDIALRDNASWVIDEFFHYGYDEFEDIKKIINTELMQCGIDPIDTNYSDLLDRFLAINQAPKETVRGTCAWEDFLESFHKAPMEGVEVSAQAEQDETENKDEWFFLDREIEEQTMTYIVDPIALSYEYQMSESSDDDSSYEDELMTQGMEDGEGEIPPVSTETTGLTSIEDKTVPDEEVQNAHVASFYSGTNPFPSQDLNDTITRLYRIVNYNWASTQNADTLIGIINFPYALLNVSPNLIEKINRWHYFRANVRVRITINGTKFHSGKLLISYQPYCSGTTTNWKHGNVFTQSTNNTVFLSPDTNQTVEFVIPYVSPFAYWQHTKDGNEGHFGSVYIRVLNPLRCVGATGSTTLSFSVWAQFENYELAGPTLHSQGLETQGKTDKTEQEQKSKGGVLSNALEATATLASIVKDVPFIGSTATLVGGTLKKASQIARIFGYSKPNSIETTKPVNLSLISGAVNGNGLNVVTELSMDLQNSLASNSDRYGKPKSETNLSDLSGLPGLFAISQIATTDAAGKVIYSFHNTPMLAHSVVNPDEGFAKADMIPCSMVGYNFQQWRGSMKYMIQFVGSKFHVCRIRISWHPTFDEIPANFTTGEGDFLSKVIDIEGDTTVTFSVPYLKETLYCLIDETWKSPRPYDSYAGAICISIVNPLTALELTVPPLQFNVFAAAGPDMDFQQPINRIGERLQILVEGPLSGDIVSQGLGDGSSGCLRDIFQHDFPPLVPSKGLSLEKVCTGEKNTSILDLCHRYQRLIQGTLTNGAYYEFKYAPVDPTYGYPRDKTLTIFQSWFLFFAGGLTQKVTPWSQLTAPDGTLYCLGNNGTNIALPNTNFWERNGHFCENFHYKPALEVSLPYYSLYPFASQKNFHVFPVEWDSNAIPDYNTLVYNWQGINAKDLTCEITWAAKDDYSFGWADGCPRLFQTDFSTPIPPEEGLTIPLDLD